MTSCTNTCTESSCILAHVPDFDTLLLKQHDELDQGIKPTE